MKIDKDIDEKFPWDPMMAQILDSLVNMGNTVQEAKQKIYNRMMEQEEKEQQQQQQKQKQQNMQG